MNWTTCFDKIFLINLAFRKDRLARASAALIERDIPFEVKTALAFDDGARGLFETMKLLFSEMLAAGWQQILVLEDDPEFTDDIHYYLPEMLHQLLEYDPHYHLFYLGANTHAPLQPVAPNILQAYRCRSSHAIAYSRPGVQEVIKHMGMYLYPYDEVLENKVQLTADGKPGRCYVAYPMLISQANGYSDIEKREVDMNYMISRFRENTKHISGLKSS